MLNAKTRVGDKVLVEAELVSLVRRAGNEDGLDLDYYLVRIPGSVKPVAVFDYALRSNEAANFKITDTDWDIENLPNVARNIRMYRQRANLSQEKAAKAIGVSQSALNAWERGVNFPRYARIVALAKLFDVSVEDITRLEAA